MNYEDIFNLVYSNSTSISESILEIVGDNYLIEEEQYKYEPLLNFIDYLTSTSISESYIDEVLSTFFGSLSEEVINEVSDEYVRRKAKAALKQRSKAQKDAEKALQSATKSNEKSASLSALKAGAATERAKKYLKPEEERTKLRYKTGARARKEAAEIKKDKKALGNYSSPYGEQVGSEVNIEKREQQYKSLQDRRKKFREERPLKKITAFDKLKGAVKKVWDKTKKEVSKVDEITKGLKKEKIKPEVVNVPKTSEVPDAVKAAMRLKKRDGEISKAPVKKKSTSKKKAEPIKSEIVEAPKKRRGRPRKAINSDQTQIPFVEPK